MAETLSFWFDFSSPYAGLAALRLRALAEKEGVPVRWRPFFLGAVFKARTERDGSTIAGHDLARGPLDPDPDRGPYMWTDVARRAAYYGFAMRRPAPFPARSLAAIRIAAAAQDEAWTPIFVEHLYRAAYADGADISEEPPLRAALEAAGADADAWLARAKTDGKEALRRLTENALAQSIFGAPSFTIGDALFWGDDRLEEALAWAKGTHPAQAA